MTAKRAAGSSGATVRSIVLGLAFTAVVVVLLLWLAGAFHAKIGSGSPPPTVPERALGDTPLVEARLVRTPAIESAVGTIRAVHQTAVASKLLAKVLAVKVQAGDPVSAGDVLVQLDQEDLEARRQQAQAAVKAARAAREQAQVEFDRVKGLYDQNNATAIEFERAQTALKSTAAELDRVEQVQREAETVLGYATIRSPLTGKVVDKRVDAGDTVTPGQVLLSLYDPTRMQLVASVRESLAQRLAVGQDIRVQVDALAKTCQGQISEIVPEAEAASRTFQVKVTGPCPPGIYSGMFGRLLIPLDEEEVLLIPRAAVRRIGQLDSVDVAEPADAPQVLRRRTIQLGRTYGDDVEVLSGLRPGEKVAVPGR